MARISAEHLHVVLAHAEWRAFTLVGADEAAKLTSAATNAAAEASSPPAYVAESLDHLHNCAAAVIACYGV